MEPLVCVVPQSMRVLIERLPAYIAFIEQQGYSVYRQLNTRLSATQAHTLYARTQDELFSLHTPVAVLLLERKQPYAAWQAVREQLDIVYGSASRTDAMDDIYMFFASADEEQQSRSTPPPQAAKAAAAIPPSAPTAQISQPMPPSPPSGPPPPSSSDEGEEAIDGALLASANTNWTQSIATQPLPPLLPPTPLNPNSAGGALDTNTVAAAETGVPLLSPPPPQPTAPSQALWEEICIQPTSASPRPSTPSDSPVSFHGAPDTPLPPPDEPLDGEAANTLVDSNAPLRTDLPTRKQNDTRLESSDATDLALPPSPPSDAEVQANSLPGVPKAPLTVAAFSELISPLRRMSATKRGSLDAGQAASSSVSTAKGPLDLLALPARRSIKERLAALNLSQEPAQAGNGTAAVLPLSRGGDHSGKLPSSPALASTVPAEERRASVSMQHMQATLSTLLAKSARLSLDKGKTPIPGARVIVPLPPPTAVCPFASVAALAPNGPLPTRSSLAPSAFEYTSNLPSAALLLAAAKTQRGVVHHMTGEDEEWGQRYAVLHFDSLYVWPAADPSHDEPQLMICVSEPAISVSYAEGVIEVKGPAEARHLLAAELPDVERWYHELTRAKIELDSEDKRKSEEASSSRRSSLHNPLVASLAIGVSKRRTDSLDASSRSSSPLNVQQQLRQMRDASGAAGVSAVRPGRGEGSKGEQEGAEVDTTDNAEVAASLRALQAQPNALQGSFPTAVPAGGMYDTAQLDDSAYLRSLLLHGALFTKYKYKRGKQRWVWCSPQLDTLYWAEEKGRKVKGQLSTATISGVADGCVGVRRKGVGLTLVAEDRTLNLEARDEEQQKDWLRAINLLVNINRQ